MVGVAFQAGAQQEHVSAGCVVVTAARAPRCASEPLGRGEHRLCHPGADRRGWPQACAPFASLSSATALQHFLRDAIPGPYRGFCGLGVYCQTMENPTFEASGCAGVPSLGYRMCMYLQAALRRGVVFSADKDGPVCRCFRNCFARMVAAC